MGESFDWTNDNTVSSPLLKEKVEDILEDKGDVNFESDLYSEKFIHTFSGAVKEIEKREKYRDRNETASFCVIDIDGTLITKNLVKLPFVSHFAKPVIPDDIQYSFKDLNDILDESSVAIATNRGSKNNLLWPAEKIYLVTKELVDKTDKNIPIFDMLFKQKPDLLKENIANLERTSNLNRDSERILDENRDEAPYQDWNIKELKTMKPKVDALVHYIGKRITESSDVKKLNLYSIEDLSIASPNREDFLIYIANQIKQNYGIEVEIMNFVIKK